MRPPTVCRHPVSGSLSLPLSGCFSPFPHGTGSLSVMHEYLGLEGGPPTFRQDFTCPALLKDNEPYAHTGLSPATARLSRRFCFHTHCHWPGPRSLATTSGVSVDVLSCGYLDVSVPRVRFLTLWIQVKIPFIDTWKPFRSSLQTTCRFVCPHGRTALRADLRTGRATWPDAQSRLRCYRTVFFSHERQSKEKEFEARSASQGRPAVAASAAPSRRIGPKARSSVSANKSFQPE